MSKTNNIDEQTVPLTENDKNIQKRENQSTKLTETESKSSKVFLFWGRNYELKFSSILLSFGVFFGAPWIVLYYFKSFHYLNGSYFIPFVSNSLTFWELLPKPSWNSLIIFSIWYLFQLILFMILPGKKVLGRPTPAGNKLIYFVNGLFAWMISFSLFIIGAYVFNLFPATIIADNWEGLLVMSNIFGFSNAFFCYIKAYLFPSHPEDCKFSGFFLYDFVMGIEMNPRIGQIFDFKLFFNGRPGIVAWTLINLSFAASQFQRFGAVSNTMILVNYLHLLYVVDFFFNEEWYIHTIDIAHDHFGFYLAWGDAVYLPFMYTLQAQYLSYNSVELSWSLLIALFLVGSASYLFFRLINNQRDYIRRNEGKCMIWGKPASYISAEYNSVDGKKFKSLLVTCGYWGLARHLNYLADIVLSLSACMCTGFESILPYFYVFFMVALLLHRVERDDQRCYMKYGKYWIQYRQKVPYKIIPYIY